jgi:cyclopropane-fatty-acyl-phospholipid synthase
MSSTASVTLTRAAPMPAAARTVLAALRALRHGVLDVQLPDGSTLQCGTTPGATSAPAAAVLRASIRLLSWKPCAAVLRSGDIGLAESYFAGDWTTPDLAALLTLVVANRDAVETLVYGSWWGSLLHRLRHRLNRNSRRGSAKNIHAHYDLGNAFYRLWLDPTMNYSSAWFDGEPGTLLVPAQMAKMSRALSACRVEAGHRVLEIGCGWGALAEHAARAFGATVTGVTLSTEQLAWARGRLAAAGIAADLHLQDYRALPNPAPGAAYDAVVSIEMFEAVGREYWPGFFATLDAQLKAGGSACIQTITIRDDLYDRYLRSTDFIQQYIFPGGLLPSASAFRAAAAEAGFAVVDELAFGEDYAETLRRWRAGFLASEGAVRQLGFDTRFVRIWEFYLAYCEAAFATGNTSVVQFTLRRAAG